MDQRRLPELFCGFPRRKGRGPTLYPIACSPQAWASAAIFQLMQSLLGLSFDPERLAVGLTNPQLPDSIREIRVRNLRVGAAGADFTHVREGARVRLAKASGDLSVSLSV